MAIHSKRKNVSKSKTKHSKTKKKIKSLKNRMGTRKMRGGWGNKKTNNERELLNRFNLAKKNKSIENSNNGVKPSQMGFSRRANTINVSSATNSNNNPTGFIVDTNSEMNKYLKTRMPINRTNNNNIILNYLRKKYNEPMLTFGNIEQNNIQRNKTLYNAYVDLATDYSSKGNIKASKDYFTRAFELEIKHVVKYMLIEEAIKQKVTVDTLKQNNPNIETQFLNHTRNRIQIRDANREASARKTQA